MPIPDFILDRIKTARFDSVRIANMFAALAQAADTQDAEDSAIVFHYIKDDDPVQPGDLIPTITFSVERQA
ncbi:MAG: hypothetical protein ACYDH4_12040 [Candidatus Cryosericum sp.]